MLHEDLTACEAAAAAECKLTISRDKIRAAALQTNSELSQQQALLADLDLQQLDLSNTTGAFSRGCSSTFSTGAKGQTAFLVENSMHSKALCATLRRPLLV